MDFSDDEVGCGGDALATRVVEAVPPSTRKNRLIRDAFEGKRIRELRVLAKRSIAIAGDLPVEKQAKHPLERIRSRMPSRIPIVECVKWTVE
jgi:hypothetical protein